MKNKKRYISILVLMISMIACCFVFASNNVSTVYAAETQDCYYLINQNGEGYLANVAVGKIDGTGKYVVGEENILLKATANINYQLVGWQIVLEEQDNEMIFIDNSADGDESPNLFPL